MSYINREEAISQIEELQSLYVGQYFDLVGRTLEIIKNMKPGEVCIVRNTDKMIKRYVKKPIEIEAIQWTGDNIDEIISFVGISNIEINQKEIYQDIGELYILTLEGAMHVSINDFIIKGVKGEFYPCKPDIFYETYIEA